MANKTNASASRQSISRRTHEVLQLTGATSAAFIAFGAGTMAFSAFVVADFNMDVAIILLTGATPGSFLRWVAVNFLLFLTASGPLASGMAAGIAWKHHRDLRMKIKYAPALTEKEKAEILEDIRKRRILIVLMITFLAAIYYTHATMGGTWIDGAISVPSWVVGVAQGRLSGMVRPYVIWLTLALWFFVYLQPLSLFSQYWTPRELVQWNGTSYVVQQVSAVEEEIIFFAPVNQELLRIPKNEIESRNYCLAWHGNEYSTQNTFGLKYCP